MQKIYIRKYDRPTKGGVNFYNLVNKNVKQVPIKHIFTTVSFKILNVSLKQLANMC